MECRAPIRLPKKEELLSKYPISLSTNFTDKYVDFYAVNGSMAY